MVCYLLSRTMISMAVLFACQLVLRDGVVVDAQACVTSGAFATPIETTLSLSSSTPSCKEFWVGPLTSRTLILLGFTNNVLECGAASDIVVLSENRHFLHSFCAEKALTNVQNGFYNYEGRYVIVQLQMRTSGSISTFMHFNRFGQVNLAG